MIYIFEYFQIHVFFLLKFKENTRFSTIFFPIFYSPKRRLVNQCWVIGGVMENDIYGVLNKLIRGSIYMYLFGQFCNPSLIIWGTHHTQVHVCTLPLISDIDNKAKALLLVIGIVNWHGIRSWIIKHKIDFCSLDWKILFNFKLLIVVKVRIIL